jgi:hypothetical protein
MDSDYERSGGSDQLEGLFQRNLRRGRIAPSCVSNQSKIRRDESEGNDNQQNFFGHGRDNSYFKREILRRIIKSKMSSYLYHTRP